MHHIQPKKVSLQFLRRVLEGHRPMYTFDELKFIKFVNRISLPSQTLRQVYVIKIHNTKGNVMEQTKSKTQLMFQHSVALTLPKYLPFPDSFSLA